MRLLSFLPKVFRGTNQIYSFLSQYVPWYQTPFMLRIRITQRCNMACPYCFLKASLNQEEKDHLRPEDWEKIFKTLPFWTNLDITGAEPFAAHEFENFLAVASRFPFRKSITTNGYNIGQNKAEWIFKYKIDYLMVSLDGLEEKHDLMRDKKGSFLKAIEFLDYIAAEKQKRKSKGPVLNIKYTLQDENYDDLVPLIHFLQERYNNRFILTLNLLQQNSALSLEKLHTSLDELEANAGNKAQYNHVRAIQETILKVSQIRNLNYSYSPSFKNQSDLFSYINNPANSFVRGCNLYRNNLTLYYNGTIMPCNLSLNLGSIRETGYDLSKIYKMQSFLKFKDRFQEEKNYCQGCCSGCHQNPANYSNTTS